MIYLAVSVICSVAVAALLKGARRFGLDARQMIAVNYAMAALLCWLFLAPHPVQAVSIPHAGPLVLALGVVLPIVFLAMAQSVRHVGVARSDAAQRLSLCVSLAAAFVLFGETYTIQKGVGIAAALAALVCLLSRAAGRRGAGGQFSWIWPLTVWVGYAVVDILFKMVAQTGAAFPGVLLVTFVLAGVLMLFWLFVRRVPWGVGNLLAGLLLGALNFANIYTYIKAHQNLPGNPALVFAAMNMGVIVLGALTGAAVFGEKLSRVNWLGVALALGAIGILMPR